MKLLVVDDDLQQNKILEDAVDLYNRKAETQIYLDVATTLESGLEKIRTSNTYDGAIVDLRLEKNDSEGLGNQILKEIVNNLRFPVRVITAHKGDLDPEFQIENCLLKCRGRGEEEYDVILNEFCEIFATGITQILNYKGQIDSNITNIFWKHISSILPVIISYKKENNSWDGQRVLVRYISSHILEYLEINIDNNLVSVHDIEFYIKPPIKEKIFTGDIIRLYGTQRFGVVLTPACDLATDDKRSVPKAKFLTIAMIEKYDNVIDGKSAGHIRRLKANNMDLKFHYLPSTVLFEGGFVNFQNIFSLDIKDADDKLKDLSKLFKVECIVTNPFRKDIISRFSNYFSRQGQPTFD